MKPGQALRIFERDWKTKKGGSMKATTAIRLTLTMALLVGVYLETGIFTTIFAGLMFLYTEAAAFIARKKGLYK